MRSDDIFIESELILRTKTKKVFIKTSLLDEEKESEAAHVAGRAASMPMACPTGWKNLNAMLKKRLVRDKMHAEFHFTR